MKWPPSGDKLYLFNTFEKFCSLNEHDLYMYITLLSEAKEVLSLINFTKQTF